MLSALRLVLLFFFRQVIRVFFRQVEVVGAPSASTSRRLFGANHVNGLIDPILVMTSTWCRIAPLAKAPLWKVPGLSLLLRAAEAVPVVRKQDAPDKAADANESLFGTVSEHLTRGGNVLIFPEGISHSEPHVVRLKTGAGRMLAGAHARGVRGLTVQAVGLEFEERETFRSRALVIYGPVRSVDELATRPGDLSLAITEQLTADLTELVVEGESWHERRLISRVAELLAHDAGDRSLAGWNSIGRRVEAARKAIGQEHRALVDDIAVAVERYYRGLAAAGLSDAQLARGEGSEGARALRKLGLLGLLPFALLGVVLYAVPYQIPKLSPRLAGTERDVVSTYKLGLGLVSFLAWAVLLVVLALVGLPSPWGLVGAAVALAAPFAALPWLDELDRLSGEEDADTTTVIEAMEAEAPGEDELRRLRGEALAVIERTRATLGA